MNSHRNSLADMLLIVEKRGRIKGEGKGVSTVTSYRKYLADMVIMVDKRQEGGGG